jgi:DNA primase
MSQKRYADYKQLKELVTIVMILDHYDLTSQLKQSGSELRGKCPLHDGKGQRTFHANTAKNAFQCFSCGKKGNILDFVAARENCSIQEASILIADWFQIETSDTAPDSPAPQKPRKKAEKPADIKPRPEPDIKPEDRNKPLPFALRIDPSHAYGFDRGLTGETIQTFGTGLCVSKGMFAGRYVIPIHNELGQIVAYAGRSLDEETEPKYLFPPSEKGFFKSELIFNLHRVIKLASADDLVYVVEGFFATMHFHQLGLPCVALMGSSLSPAQEDLLVQNFNRLALVFDGDPAGRKCADECLRRLARRCQVRVIDLADDEQPDCLSDEQIKARLFAP